MFGEPNAGPRRFHRSIRYDIGKVQPSTAAAVLLRWLEFWRSSRIRAGIAKLDSWTSGRFPLRIALISFTCGAPSQDRLDLGRQEMPQLGLRVRAHVGPYKLQHHRRIRRR